ncbi:MAG TPA: MarR family winged helix-turn-helix transcriptional regulator [Solirubrobacteraceae bacterium]|nr:MarR family winged helix-turn-helix transcriptional regulator [Solirubrobacteraceae bacterium]
MASIDSLQTGRVLGSVGSRTGFLLTILGDSFQRTGRDVLAAHQLKPRQLRILDLLADRGPVGQRELAELMGIDHSVLVNLLNPLEAERLIKRERDTADRRKHVVSIAAAGQRRLAQADQAFRDAEDAFFAALDAGEREQLHAMLSRLRDGAGAAAGA